MTTVRRSRVMVLAALLAGAASIAEAQGVDIAPIGGYRFGGDFFELSTGQRLDLDGAPAFGIVVDLPFDDDFQIEGLFTRQQAHAVIATGLIGQTARVRLVVDHWQGGGLRELRGGSVRPFLTGMLGLTRYAGGASNEIRFTLSAGGGVKLLPTRHVGVRLDSRLFATFADATARSGGVGLCTPGLCFSSLYANVVWQMEFTAALVIAFR